MVIQHLPLISCSANLAGDRTLCLANLAAGDRPLLAIFSDNSTNIHTDRVIFLVIICAFHYLISRKSSSCLSSDER